MSAIGELPAGDLVAALVAQDPAPTRGVADAERERARLLHDSRRTAAPVATIVRSDQFAADEEAKPGRAVLVVDTAEPHGHPGDTLGLGERLDDDGEVTDLDALANLVELHVGGLLIGDPPELDAAGEQDREPADHGEDQQGPGAHRRNATDAPSGRGLLRLTTIASRFDIVDPVTAMTADDETRRASVSPLTDGELLAWRSYVETVADLETALELDLAPTGLTLGDYQVLVFLSEADGHSMRMCDLAANLQLSPSGLTRRLDGLVRHGLVDREPSASDRRVMLAVLTDEGVAKLAEAYPVHLASVRTRIIDRLSPADVESLGRIFATIHDGLRAGLDP